MEKQRVYDLPTRLTHWLFAGLFIASFAIAKLTDDESAYFPYHMIFGIILFVVTIMRLTWGFVGSRYAKFSSFPLHPLKLFEYFRDILSSGGKKYFGHNPASAWAGITMMILAIGLGVTGYLMTTGYKETFEDIHELLANGFAIVAVSHIAGVILHGLRHRDGIAFSMLHGKKDFIHSADPITNSHSVPAMVMAGIIAVVGFQTFRGYDPQNSKISAFGLKLQLGENESQEGGLNRNEEEDDD